MSISSISHVARERALLVPTAQGAGTTDAVGGDGSDTRKSLSAGGHGRMRQAVEEAFQSLGLSMPSTSASSPSASPSGQTAGPGQSPSADKVKGDLHHFMHALFQAVRAESSSTSSSSATSATNATTATTATTASTTSAKATSGDSSSSFSDGLTALIAQTASGTAPAALQSAFNQLAGDLQGSQATPTAVDPSAPPISSATGPSLQDLLSRVQQDLGYGPSKTTSTGNAVSTQV